MPDPSKPLARLREIRRVEEAADARREERHRERDELMRHAVLEGHSERTVAAAIGLSRARVNEISGRPPA